MYLNGVLVNFLLEKLFLSIAMVRKLVFYY